MMKRLSRVAAALGLGLVVATPSFLAAAPTPEDSKKQTPWGLYLTAEEAYEMKQEGGDKVLLVDVREPIEIMFTGFSDVIDINVPYLLVNPAKWNPKKPVLAMEQNLDFASGIMQALDEHGLDETAPVILMCRLGGTRGAPSALALEGLGLQAVYVVVDGFEGTTSKEAPNAPLRNVNGWKNAGLPWGYELDPEKIPLRP